MKKICTHTGEKKYILTPGDGPTCLPDACHPDYFYSGMTYA